MKNIKFKFEYDLPDEMYYQTNDEEKTAEIEYDGPEKLYLEIDKSTNKFTGRLCDKECYESFDSKNSNVAIIEVDCYSEPEICFMFGRNDDTENVRETYEYIEGKEEPYDVGDPLLPDEVYEIDEIEYDFDSSSFKRPLPWAKPPAYWDDVFKLRNNLLQNTDRLLSEDLPKDLYNKIFDFRQFIRDVPETFGANWKIKIKNPGTNYSVGDKISINDSVYKNGNTVNEIMIEVTQVNNDGGVENFKKLTTPRAFYHPEAGTYDDVFHITNKKGQDSVLQLSKVKTIDPWKIDLPEPPIS